MVMVSKAILARRKERRRVELERLQDFAAGHGFKTVIVDDSLVMTIWYVVQAPGQTGNVKEIARNAVELNAILGY